MRKLLKKIEGKRNIILFLDYDGTIVPIKEKPWLAKLHPLRRRLLEEISKEIPVAIVSGRSLSELKKLIRSRRISLIGNHGYEILYKGKLWVHPEAMEMRDILNKILKQITRKSKNLKGLIVEDKGLSGSVHFRLLEPELEENIRKIVKEEVEKAKGRLKIREGKKVLEIRPGLNWDKGKGVKKLISFLKLKGDFLRIYIGDDKTDEDAFRIFGEKDITILVGRGKESLAKYRLKNVDEVWKFLREISKMLKNIHENSG